MPLILLGFPTFCFWEILKSSQPPSQTGMIPIIELKRYDLLDLHFIFFHCFIAEIIVTSGTGYVRVPHLGGNKCVCHLVAIKKYRTVCLSDLVHSSMRNIQFFTDSGKPFVKGISPDSLSIMFKKEGSVGI